MPRNSSEGKAGMRIDFMTLVVLAAVLAGCGKKQESGGWAMTQVALTQVERVEAPRMLHAAGELEAVRQVQLASEVAGRVSRIQFSSGQAVKAGQVLVQINDAPEQAERVRLTAQLHNAERILERTQALHADQLMTQAQLDGAIAARDMARGELQRIQAIIAQKAIRAPFAGVMGIARVHQGQYLNPGDAIASLVDPGGLRANFALPEQALALVSTGQAVEIRVDAWPDEIFSGTISAIDPMVTQARTVWVQARIANPGQRLQAGMFANVTVQMPEAAPVLAVPETAITYASYGQTVFIAEDQGHGLHVRQVAVTAGQRWQGPQRALVEIINGLHEGQQVIVSGQIKLADGMPVIAAGSAP